MATDETNALSNDNRNRGIVYVLSNPAMDGLIKIGETNGDSARNVLDRMKELDTTGVPLSFRCEYAALVNDRRSVESALHVAFGENRIRQNREFFAGIPPFRVKAMLRLVELADVTPDEAASSDEGSESSSVRTPIFRFSSVGIPVGAEVDWADDTSIKCKVVSDRRVEFNGEEYALSKLTAELKRWNVNYAQVGPYWLHDGKTLDEWRQLAADE